VNCLIKFFLYWVLALVIVVTLFLGAAKNKVVQLKILVVTVSVPRYVLDELHFIRFYRDIYILFDLELLLLLTDIKLVVFIELSELLLPLLLLLLEQVLMELKLRDVLSIPKTLSNGSFHLLICHFFDFLLVEPFRILDELGHSSHRKTAHKMSVDAVSVKDTHKLYSLVSYYEEIVLILLKVLSFLAHKLNILMSKFKPVSLLKVLNDISFIQHLL
jgi:hypothetical protein